ncbi:MAG: D-alanyl-D-alanine carboxypeptidase [Desulfofustis sp.]|nr:D-alanyl-D-alanine carboxypeptidase [Desulfofustis sp.]
MLLLLWAFFYTAVSVAEDSSSLDTLIENGGYVLTRNGTTIAELNSDTLLIPASTIKIATALSILEILEPSHRIKTEFYLRNNKILCVKGYGDPYLISERVQDIALSLKDKGLDRVESILLDDSFFQLEGPPDGAENSANPYDVLNSALAVNFNTVALIKHDTGTIDSLEPQTPMLDITGEIGTLVEPGLHRVNVSAFSHRNTSITPHRLTAELIAAQLRRQNIAVGKKFHRGRVETNDSLLYTYHSEMTVAEMLRACLKYSNNFIANQLFLYCGALKYGAPATWEKAREAMTNVLYSTTGLKSEEVIIFEGSGLSRKNMITPAAAITLLERFKPYASLLSETEHILLKSGTMTGVYGYAGYFSSGENLDPFIILLNQKINNKDRLLKLSRAYYDHQARQEKQP